MGMCVERGRYNLLYVGVFVKCITVIIKLDFDLDRFSYINKSSVVDASVEST